MNPRLFSILLNGVAFLFRVGLGLLTCWILWRLHPLLAIVAGGLVFGFFANIVIAIGDFFSKPMGNPVCKNGKCKTSDYKYVKWIGNHLHKRCSCGDNYLLTMDRFMSLDDDGIARPYMIYKSKKEGWIPDTSGEIIDTNAIQEEVRRVALEESPK